MPDRLHAQPGMLDRVFPQESVPALQPNGLPRLQMGSSDGVQLVNCGHLSRNIASIMA